MFSNFSDKEIDKLYEMRHIDAYEMLVDTDGWSKCGRCGVHPRSWRFNNGIWATCLCFRKYEEHPVRTESVLSVLKRTGLTVEYEPDTLRTQWNKFAADGVMRNKLPEGQW